MKKPDPSAADKNAPPMAETLARATAAVAKLAADYPVLALRELGRCQDLLDTVRAGTASREPQYKALFAIAHDLKGQGSSFGYPLATRVADSLCRLLRGPGAATADPELAQSHLDTLALIYRKNIAGDGGETGQRLTKRLESLVQEHFDSGPT